MTSPATERFRRWVAAETPSAPLVRFRVAFAAIWLVYDVLDLTLAGTARIHDWPGAGPAGGLPMIQVALLAAALRGLEWYAYLQLNDFAYYGVTALILAQTPAVGGVFTLPQSNDAGGRATVTKWPRDVLVWQAAWMYFATALLKVNPTWLSGRHLYVRFQYLRFAFGWRFPDLMNRCADSLGCDALLAAGGVLGEVTLAVLLFVYPRRRLALPIACGIHIFAAFATNVWFFGPSLIAQVGFLTYASMTDSRKNRDTSGGLQAS
jgi:hypothetical protein